MRRGIVPVLLLFPLAACATRDRAASADTTPSATQQGAASPNVVTFHAKDFAFAGPSEIPAGLTTFDVVNDGPGLHHLQLVRLDSGRTMADLEAALKHPGPPTRWAVFVGGPNAPSPGRTGNATLEMTPGTYAILCMVDVPGGVPHFARGMVHALTVTSSAAPAAPAPAADVSIRLTDYAFDLSTPLTAGRHTFAVRVDAPQPHEVELVRLAPGKTVQDMMAWMPKMQGPPPGEALGGVAALAPGATASFTADLTPGNYLFMCMVPDARDGKPHAMHGMVKAVTIS